MEDMMTYPVGYNKVIKELDFLPDGADPAKVMMKTVMFLLDK